MMIRGGALAFLAVVAVVLQGTLLYQAAPGGVTIDLALVLTMFVGWRWGALAGTAMGLWCGALVGAAMGASVEMGLLYGLWGWALALLASLHPNRGCLRAALFGGAIAVSQSGIESALLGSWTHPAAIPWILLWHGLGLGLLVLASSGRLRLPRRRRWAHRGGKELWTADWALLAYAG